jgi:hypothetical protein
VRILSIPDRLRQQRVFCVVEGRVSDAQGILDDDEGGIEQREGARAQDAKTTADASDRCRLA